MVEERVYVERGPSALGVFLAIIVIAFLVVGGVLWSTGALVVGRDAQNRLQVTFDPARAENAGDDALEKTGQALEDAGEKIKRQARKNDASREATPAPVRR
jgi:hypothetical protein